MLIHPLFQRPARRGTVFALVASLTLLATAGAAEENLSESVRRNETGQQQIQQQAKEFAAQLRGMSAEFERNGLTGDSLRMLDLLSKAVGSMSDQDMARIIGQLRQARTLNDKNAVLQQVTAAFVDQKKLTTDMKGWLSRYQKDQVTADVAARLAKLAERQSTNFQAGVAVAQWNSTKRPNGKPDDEKAADNAEALKAAVDMQSSEQAALRDEAKMAPDRLANVARDKSDPAAAARAQAALDRLKALNATLDQAADDLKNGRLFKAVVSEKAARDGLRQLARDLTPLRQNDADALRQAAHDLDEMAAQQKAMIAETTKEIQPPADFEKWLQQGLSDPKSAAHQVLNGKKLLGKTLDELKGEKAAQDAFDGHQRQLTNQSNQRLTALESRANDIVNKSDEISQDLRKDAPQAAAAVKAAQDKMQAARADLDEHSAAAALQNQQNALAQTEQAQKQIKAQLAAQDAYRNADRATQLQAIKQQGKELAAQQNAATQQQALQPQAGANHAAQETQLRKQAQELQEKAAQAQSPAAAASLQNAANQMEKAASALNQPSGQPQAQAAEAAAQAELAKADAQLDKEIAQAAAAQQALKQTDQALAALEVVIAGQVKLQADTTLLSSKPVGTPAANEPKGGKGARNAGPPITTLASSQSKLKTDTGSIIPLLNTPELKPAAPPLTAAQEQMTVSHGALTRADAPAALGPEQVAITDLLQAKEILNAKKAELQQQTNPQAAEEQQKKAEQTAAQQIAQAQQQAQQAQQQMAQQQQQNGQQQAQNSGQQQSGQQQSQSGQQQAQQSLTSAANLAGQAAANTPSAAAPGVSQNLQQAQKSLNAAAAASAQGKNADAQALTQKALDALAQAQAQASAAQAGLAQAPDQNGAQPPPGGQPPGNQPGAKGSSPQAGKPGQPPGQKPGQQPGQQPGPASPDAPAGSGDRDPSRIGEAGIEKGSRDGGKRGSAFTNLPARDRAALQQSQSEKYPQEYGSMIEQYMQNLADQPGS